MMSGEEQGLVQPKVVVHDPYVKPTTGDSSVSDDEGGVMKPGNSVCSTSLSTPSKTKPSLKGFKNSKEQQSSESGHDLYFVWSALVIEAIIILTFSVSCDYHDASSSQADESRTDYGPYQDVHVMMFIGFGFLMTFLRKYGFGSISINMLLTAIALQWGLLVFHWVATGYLWDGDHNENRIRLETHMLVDGDISAATVLISFGAVLGRTSPTQLIWMAFFELIIFAFNFYLCVQKLHIVDVGGSIVVHTFGAYFGLAVSYVLGEPKNTNDNKSMYHSDLFAMIGTLFLWVYWPSFNGFFASEIGFFRDRAFINTVLSLSACTVSTFLFSKLFTKGKFDMVHVQNATLAGGVAVGAAADLYVSPGGALFVGVVAAFLSVWGYCKLQDYLEHYWCVWDTCGVHNLHGMPGVLGALVSAVTIWAAGGRDDKESLYLGGFGCRGDGSCHFWYDWGKQGFMQIAGVVLTIGIAIAGGAVVGYFIKLIDNKNYYKVKSWFHDSDNFELPKGKSMDIFRGTIRGKQFSMGMKAMDSMDEDE